MAITLTSTPDALSWSRHPIAFELTSDATGYNTLAFKVELWEDATTDRLIATYRTNADANKKAVFDFSRPLTDQLSYTAPDLDEDLARNESASIQYYIKYFEIVDGVEGSATQSSSLFAILGAWDFMLLQRQYLAVDTAKEYIFLTSKPLERRLFEWQEEVFTVLFTAAQMSTTLRYVLHYTDGTNSGNQDLSTGAVSQAGVYTGSFSFRHKDFQTVAGAKTIARIELSFAGLTGDTLIYKVEQNSSRFKKSFVYANKRGGFDVLAATGASTLSEQTRGEVYELQDGTTQAKQRPTQDVVQQLSGFIDRSETGAYAQMRDTNKVWEVLENNHELAAITLELGTTKQKKDGENLNAFDFGYTYGSGRQDFDIINAIEFEGAGMSLPINISDVTGLQSALDVRPVIRQATLALNATTFDALGAQIVYITASSYDSSQTLTFSNVSNVKEIRMRLTNTNANTLTFAGITVKFIADELPSGLSLAANGLTFPSDTAIAYNIVLVPFDGTTFRGKIEIDG